MRSEIKQKQEKITFPCLMKSKEDGCVVLFTSFSKGTVVHEGDSPVEDELGSYSEDWHMEVFERFNGVIKLEN